MAATQAYIAKLASTIQGEGRGQDAQFAIAATMQNRLNAGIDTPRSLLSVNSFQANDHVTAPTPFATQMATAVANGNVGDYGDTGNATYYNGRGGKHFDTYSQGGSIIGGNAYSDRYGKVPSTDYQAPSYDPGRSGSSQTATDAQQDADQDADATDDYNSGYGTDPFATSSPGSDAYIGDNGAAFTPMNGGLPSFAQGDGGATTPYYSSGIGTNGAMPYFTNMGTDGSENSADTGSDFSTIDQGTFTQNNGAGAAGDSAPPLTVPVGSGDVGTSDDPSTTGDAQYTSPDTTTPDTQADTSTSVDAGMDVPSAIDGLAAAITSATNSQDKTSAAASKAASQASANADKNNTALIKQLVGEIGKSTTQSTSTSQDIVSTTKQYATNLFVRGAIIALGLIFVFVGLTMFRSVQENVIKPVAKGAKKAVELAA